MSKKKKYKKVRVAKPKFKVGDRVYVYGETGTIKEITKRENKWLYYVGFVNNESFLSILENEIKLCKDETIEDTLDKFASQPLYETTFKHKYKVGDRVETTYGTVGTIKKVGFGFLSRTTYDFTGEPRYLIEDNVIIDESEIKGLAPRELLSREEKHLLLEEIQRCYDRWDDCPEIKYIEIAKPEKYVSIYLDDENYNTVNVFKVSTKLFKSLENAKNYSLKELGLEED